MTSWPGSLPSAPLQASFQGTTNGGALRTDMDQGPAYQRPNGPQLESFSVSFLFDLLQYATFRAFWQDDLLNGTQPFAWVHPELGTAAQVRFDASRGFTRVSEADWVTVSCTLEVLP